MIKYLKNKFYALSDTQTFILGGIFGMTLIYPMRELIIFLITL